MESGGGGTGSLDNMDHHHYFSHFLKKITTATFYNKLNNRKSLKRIFIFSPLNPLIKKVCLWEEGNYAVQYGRGKMAIDGLVTGCKENRKLLI